MKRIILRADASKKTGYGHFVRSLALAGYLKSDFDCRFATYNADNTCGLPSAYQLEEIEKICAPLPVTGDSLSTYDIKFLKEIGRDDIVILDNYYYSTEYQAEIKERCRKLVCIDDVHDRHFVCDLLMTACALEKSVFSLEPYTEFVGGIKWAFLREPFLRPATDREKKSQVERIVLAMGGADAFNVTDKMIGVVKKVLPDAEIDVIGGDTATISFPESDKIRIHHRLGAEKIVDLFDRSDVGIFPASTICKEAYSRRLPVIAGYYVDNQVESYNYGCKNKLFSGIGCLLDSPDIIAARLEDTLSSNMPGPVDIDFKSQRNKIVEIFRKL